jgi:hypothetical protein
MAISIHSTYATGYAAGFAGMVANGEESNRISRTVEDSAGIAFGKAAFRGSGDHGVTATPAAGTFMGVTIADAGIVGPVGAAVDTYLQYSTASLLNEGCIYVTVGVNVADGDQAYVTPAGVWTNTSNSSANPQVPAKFDETVSSGGICRLRVTRS